MLVGTVSQILTIDSLFLDRVFKINKIKWYLYVCIKITLIKGNIKIEVGFEKQP